MLHINLLRVILTILAENGETRTLTLIKLINNYINSIRVMEPMVFEHIINHYEDEQITIPLNNIRIDWGDGDITQINEHKYKTYGRYRVKIYNSEKQIEQINVYGWPDYIIEFISIGRIGVTSLRGLFSGNHLKFRIHPNWDTSNITDMRQMFFHASNFNQKIGDNWDISKVKDLSFIFYNANSFNQEIGNNWDTSQIINLSYMFDNTDKLQQKIGGNWNISKYANIFAMFDIRYRPELLPRWYIEIQLHKRAIFLQKDD